MNFATLNGSAPGLETTTFVGSDFVDLALRVNVWLAARVAQRYIFSISIGGAGHGNEFVVTIITGAIAQAPTQLTHSTVICPSAVVSPGSIPSCPLTWLTSSSEPLTWQAVPVQMVIRFLPRGLSENAL